MYKTHRQNHDFQIAYFLAGKCHTPDGAYALLHDLRDDRQMAIDAYHVSTKRAEAKRLRLTSELVPVGEQALDREAELMELDNATRMSKVLYEAAVAELAFIDKMIAALQPLRKYAHLPDPEAFEAAQQEEWLLELIERAENMMFCHGTLSPDHLTTMRAHPEFQTVILPAIGRMAEARRKDPAAIVQNRPGQNIVALVERSLASLPAPC